MNKRQTETSDVQINNVVYKIERVFSGEKTPKEIIEDTIVTKQ